MSSPASPPPKCNFTQLFLKNEVVIIITAGARSQTGIISLERFNTLTFFQRKSHFFTVSINTVLAEDLLIIKPAVQLIINSNRIYFAINYLTLCRILPLVECVFEVFKLTEALETEVPRTS